jgi:hypothetical protein
MAMLFCSGCSFSGRSRVHSSCISAIISGKGRRALTNWRILGLSRQNIDGGVFPLSNLMSVCIGKNRFDWNS